MSNLPADKNNLADTDGETAGHRPQSGILIYLPSRLLLGLCALQFALLLALVLMNWRIEAPAKSPPRKINSSTVPQPAPAHDSEPLFRGSPGPWGELEYVRINIELPDEFVPADNRSFEKTTWLFAGYSASQLTALFNSCDLTTAQRAELLNPAAWSATTNGMMVTPSQKLVLELNPHARAVIYSVLAESDQNDFQFWPYTFRNGGFDDWFHKSDLGDTTLALMRRLVYSRGASLCFSDLPEAFAQMPNLAEKRRLVKTLSRQATLLMKLRMRPDSDVPALTAYWARGGRAKDIGPLIQSLTKVTGSVTMDVAHLLPPFARKRLNSYPFPLDDPSKPAPDCYWTAFNFFNEPPDERYHDDSVWRQKLEEDFAVVAEPTYGDLIFLLRPNSTPIHAAVYLADNVVFTKNGGNIHQPWILMKMEDMIARYPVPYPVKIVFFRSKKITS